MIHGGEIYDKTIAYDLSVNLNPCPSPGAVKDALAAALNDVDKYPDITCLHFRKAVAEAENKLAGENALTKAHVIGGNGASELIFSIIRYLHPKNVLIPAPGFYGYRHALFALTGDESLAKTDGKMHTPETNCRVNIREYRLLEKDDFALTERMVDEIQEDTDLVIIANPNNPTGRVVDETVMKNILAKCVATGTKILIDECFLQMSNGGKSMVGAVNKVPGLFIINAYTKLFSIPGVRVGYAISSPENIRGLSRFLPEWNMSVFAQRAGIACAKSLIETDFADRTKRIVAERRQELVRTLQAQGLRVFPSDTCFVLVYSEEDLYRRFLEKNILIRDCSNFSGLKKGFYRISVKEALLAFSK